MQQNESSPYNYPRFKPDYYSFKGFDGPKIGEVAPDFSAYTLDGKKVKLSDFFTKPIILETGSLTCPVYAGVLDEMNQFAKKFSDVQFILLYTREAHPGEKIKAHCSLQEKILRAEETKSAYGENRLILVDEISGAAHKLYGYFPNSVYLIDKNNKIFWRSQWNHPKETEKAIQRMLGGKISPEESTSQIPGGIAFSALLKGGKVAVRDFIVAFPKLIWRKFGQKLFG
jgi:peroxiredoxin